MLTYLRLDWVSAVGHVVSRAFTGKGPTDSSSSQICILTSLHEIRNWKVSG